MKDLSLILLVILVILILWYFFCSCNKVSKENLSGYGVISGLAYNNNAAYCGRNRCAFGGPIIPHRVII